MKRSILLLFIVLVLLSACKVEKFSLPKWDLELNVPLISQRFYVSELVDEVNIVISEDEVLTLTATGTVDTPEIGSIPLVPAISLGGMPITSGIHQNINLPFMDTNMEVVLYYGRVGSGNLRYKFDIIEPTAEVMIELDGIKNDLGESLKIQSGTGGGWQNINLAGYHFGAEDHDEEFENMHLSINSSSDLSDDSIIATFSMEINQSLYFSDFHGLLNNYEISMNESSAAIEIDYPLNINEAITLQEAVLIIDVENELGFGCEFEGDFVAVGIHGTEVIPIKDNDGNNFIIAPASSAGPAVTHLRLENGLNTLLQAMPTQISLENTKFTISSQSGTGRVQATNILHADYRINAPFTLVLQDAPITIKESVHIEISEDNRDIFSKRAVEAKMVFEVINKTPLGGSVEAFFSVNDEIVPEDPHSYDFMKSVILLSSNASSGEPQEISLKLNQEELKLFSNPEVFLRWRFSFDDTNGEPITIHAGESDYIELRSMVSAKVLIGGGE